MPGEQNPNLVVLELVVERVGALTDDLVFLGGCATGLPHPFVRCFRTIASRIRYLDIFPETRWVRIGSNMSST